MLNHRKFTQIYCQIYEFLSIIIGNRKLKGWKIYESSFLNATLHSNRNTYIHRHFIPFSNVEGAFLTKIYSYFKIYIKDYTWEILKLLICLIFVGVWMQAVGTAPILTHHSSKQEPLNFSRFGDVLNKVRSIFHQSVFSLWMYDFNIQNSRLL